MEESIIVIINRVRHLASHLKSMTVDVEGKEISIAVLNGLYDLIDVLNRALDVLRNEDLFSIEFVKEVFFGKNSE